MPPFKNPPRDFQELIERCPRLVPNLVKNFLRYNNHRTSDKYTVFEADFEEYVQETYLWLLRVPPGKHSHCVDRIQMYDESQCPSSMSCCLHFKAFMIIIVNRFLQTYRTQRHLDAMERDTCSLGTAAPVVIDPTKWMLIDECVTSLFKSTAKGKVKNPHFLAKKFGFTTATAHERKRFQLRVSRYVEHHFSRHFEY